ncbi:TetR/AcrR family transcriptional regulator [Haloechinothrix aidingensis]|uniref:TetR/AcrR family transcriptional regulator n=1 Tax=Haloechinothrix aidingensis TaxID=2752311 RepID=UPI0031B5BC11
MAEPGTRERLVDAAIHLLSEGGPDSVQARKLAADVGVSTMAVYTHFGGMGGLVEAVARTGFDRFNTRLAEVPRGTDPVEDLFRLGDAYREYALGSPNLYSVMFGISAPAGHRLAGGDVTSDGPGEHLPEGQEAFGQLETVVSRAMHAGRLRTGDPAAVAGQVWSAIHGYVLLEIAGYFGELGRGMDIVGTPIAINLVIGLGDTGDAARASAQRVWGG